MIYRKHLKGSKIIEEDTITLFQMYRRQYNRNLFVITKYADHIAYNIFTASILKPNSVRNMQNKEGKNMGIFDHDS